MTYYVSSGMLNSTNSTVPFFFPYLSSCLTDLYTIYYAPTSVGRGIIIGRMHYKMMAGVYLSVCLSVACLDLTRERHRKPKIGRMEDHHTDNPDNP